MAVEYEDLIVAAPDVPADVLNERAADGWRVHTAYAADHFLLERGGAPAGVQPAKTPASPYR